jgi:NAD-dependent dihydropyrimidine dehydrogenase PreA subunit
VTRIPVPEERSLLTLLDAFQNAGFVDEFHSRPGGTVECGSCHETHPAESLELHALERLEGDSDPAEMVAVCAVVCPSCGTRGTLVLTYGPEATADDIEVLARLEDHRR